MVNTFSLIPAPVVISFYKDAIDRIFPVIQEKSIGIVYGTENLSVAKIQKDDLEIDEFPNSDSFSAYTSHPLEQTDPHTLLIQSSRFLFQLDLTGKKLLHLYENNSKSIDNFFEMSKEIDNTNGMILSLWSYFPMDGNVNDQHFYFVIDDIICNKRLKEIPIPKFISPLPVYFTPSYVFYRIRTAEESFPWQALDNNLEPIEHPLSKLLNDNSTIFSVGAKRMEISENLKQSLIVGYNKILKKDMLFLATWYGRPKVQPIIMDSTVLGTRRLVNFVANNTMSPSGHWVYFCAQADRIEPDVHFLIYLDPALPNGYLPPVRLELQGTVKCAGWVTNPEGLILYQGFDLYYYDLSKFKPGIAE